MSKRSHSQRSSLKQNSGYEVIHSESFSNKSEATSILDLLEEFYIKKYDSYTNGYNMTFGGYTNRGFKYTEEQKKQMSLSRLGRKGTALTEERKQQHSSLMKLKWQTPEYRVIREAIITSPEHIKKRKECVTGNKNGMYGKTHSIESKQKMSESRFGEKNYWFGKQKSDVTRSKIKNAMFKYHRKNNITMETRKKISEGCSTPVSRYTQTGDYIDTFNSITKAGEFIGIDASCITKCCKGKRGSAGGYKWAYADLVISNNILADLNGDWITTAEAVQLTGRSRNVLYYHIKHHGVPKKNIGRKILIERKALIDLFKIEK